jgi:universal stress protein E
MKTPRRILVAIKNPGSRRQPALHKAAQLATALGARLELFHAIAAPIYLDAFLLEGMTLQQTQKQWRERLVDKLEKHAQKLRSPSLAVDVSCDWDFPASEAIIRRASRSGADLIVAERHATRHVLPWLLRFNDWELLRRSPVPVLLVKRAQTWRRPAVLAAVDPSHGLAKSARLEGEILGIAQLLSVALGGKLHVAHAFSGTLLPAEELNPVSARLAISMERQARLGARKAFAAALQGAGVATARKHFVSGEPVDVIPKLARQQRVQLVVMGAVSRSGLQRLFIGNIAEQVLDSLSCDVLIVKPVSFKSPVKSRKRGVQLVPTPAQL